MPTEQCLLLVVSECTKKEGASWLAFNPGASFLALISILKFQSILTELYVGIQMFFARGKSMSGCQVCTGFFLTYQAIFSPDESSENPPENFVLYTSRRDAADFNKLSFFDSVHYRTNLSLTVLVNL